MHRIRKSELPSHFHEEVDGNDVLVEVKTSIPKKQFRCRKCNTPLRSTNPYEFCSLCLGKKVNEIRDLEKMKGNKISPKANFYERYNTDESVIARALKALELEVRRLRRSG